MFGHADARIISAAVEPLRKSSPKTTLIVLLAVAFGLASGVGSVFVSDELDRRVRTARRLQALIGVHALAALPVVRAGRRGQAALIRRALEAPDDRFAAGIRNLRVAALQCAEAGRTPAIGVLSLRRGEGRSAVAANLAALIAQGGSPTVLIDGDVLNPQLTLALAPDAEAGWADAESATPDSLLRSAGPELFLLPARAPSGAADPNGLVGFPAVVAACAALVKTHFVIVDLPAVSQSPEAEAIARRLSGVFLLIDAKATAVDECAELLERLAESDVRVLGVALNRAELS